VRICGHAGNILQTTSSVNKFSGPLQKLLDQLPGSYSSYVN
jgi:hypothetical protein